MRMVTPEADRLLRPMGQARQPGIRLVCIPYAGAASTVFHAWQQAIAPDVELRAVQLPARQDRLSEPPLTRVVSIVDCIVAALATLSRLPTVFYGHSFGALVALEVVRRLQAVGAPAAALIVGGRGAPHRPSSHTPIDQLSEPLFLQAVHHRYGTPWSALLDRDRMELALPSMRADFEAFETYVYEAAPPLAIPFTVLHGLKDASVSEADAAAWAELTCREIALHTVDAGHFFIDTHRPWVLERVGKVLAAVRGAAVGDRPIAQPSPRVPHAGPDDA